MGEVAQAAGRAQLTDLRAQVDRVFVDDEILQYVLQLVRATRSHPGLAQGASPRAAISS
jgi:MoxR-like ATPase